MLCSVRRRRSGRVAVLVAGAVLAGTLAACGEVPSAADPNHVPVSVPPGSTATPSPEPQLALSAAASGEPIPMTNFGMHITQVADVGWPDVPIGAVRIWNADSTWGALEPQPGQWDFSNLDQRVDQAEARGAEVLLVLTHPPTWAATRPDIKRYQGSPSPPRSDADWSNYVRRVAERYAGRIEAYEIWNEPNLPQFFMGTPQRVAELTELASAAIRGADPDALVVSAGFSARTEGSEPFFREYVAAMDPDAVDVVGIHIYPYVGNGPESMLDMASRFRAMADEVGLAGKPMWNTEIGYGRTPEPQQLIAGDTAASLILRTYLVLPAYDIWRNYWYLYDDRLFVGLYMLEADRQTETPAALAYGEAVRWLEGTLLTGCSSEDDRLWVCRLNRDGVPVTIAWRLGPAGSYEVPAGATVAYPFTHDPQPVTAGEPYQLSDLPVLFAPVEIPDLVG